MKATELAPAPDLYRHDRPMATAARYFDSLFYGPLAYAVFEGQYKTPVIHRIEIAFRQFAKRIYLRRKKTAINSPVDLALGQETR